MGRAAVPAPAAAPDGGRCAAQRRLHRRRWGPTAALAALALLLLRPALCMHVGLYLGAWLRTTDPNDDHYFDIDNADLSNVSHLYYSFVFLRGAPTYELYDDFGAMSTVLRARARNPNLQVVVSIGGGGFNPEIFSSMASTASSRAKFVASTRSWVLRYGLDGVDLDWESPVDKDRDNFVALVSDLRAMLDGLGPAPTNGGRYSLSTAIGSVTGTDAERAAWDLPGLSNAGIDLFNIMAYDLHDPCYWESQTNFHTSWSIAQRSINYIKSQGVPPSKLVLGLAFYGHAYTLKDSGNFQYPAPSVQLRQCNKMDTPSYADVMAELASKGGSVFVNDAERAAYYVRDMRWVGFEIEETLWAKMQGARDNGLAGVMAWEALLDTHSHRLINTIRSGQPPPVRPCGGGFVGSGRCADASQCCSLWGYCGSSKYECGPGCRGGPCYPYASSPPPPPALPLCGDNNIGSATCEEPLQCCSKFGWCGEGDDWCGDNCVGGNCNDRSLRTAPPPPRSPPPSPDPVRALQPSPPPAASRPCGGGRVNDGTCEVAGYCCSRFGYCGDTPGHCGIGCQGGACWPQPPPPPGVTEPPTCGEGDVGNKRCWEPSMCCSEFGWCADDPDHCNDKYCVGGNCYRWRGAAAKAPPPPPKRGNKKPPKGKAPRGGGR